MFEKKMAGSNPEPRKMFDEKGLPTGLEDELMNPPLEDYEKAPDERGDEYQAQQEEAEREKQAAELDADAKWDRQFAEAGQRSLAKRDELLKLSKERKLTSAEMKELADWEKDLQTHWPELLK